MGLISHSEEIDRSIHRCLLSLINRCLASQQCFFSGKLKCPGVNYWVIFEQMLKRGMCRLILLAKTEILLTDHDTQNPPDRLET